MLLREEINFRDNKLVKHQTFNVSVYGALQYLFTPCGANHSPTPLNKERSWRKVAKNSILDSRYFLQNVSEKENSIQIPTSCVGCICNIIITSHLLTKQLGIWVVPQLQAVTAVR